VGKAKKRAKSANTLGHSGDQLPSIGRTKSAQGQDSTVLGAGLGEAPDAPTLAKRLQVRTTARPQLLLAMGSIPVA
jgi:hypothetical protein